MFENGESFMKFNKFKKGLARDLGLNLLSVLFVKICANIKIWEGVAHFHQMWWSAYLVIFFYKIEAHTHLLICHVDASGLAVKNSQNTLGAF